MGFKILSWGDSLQGESNVRRILVLQLAPGATLQFSLTSSLLLRILPHANLPPTVRTTDNPPIRIWGNEMKMWRMKVRMGGERWLMRGFFFVEKVEAYQESQLSFLCRHFRQHIVPATFSKVVDKSKVRATMQQRAT